VRPFFLSPDLLRAHPQIKVGLLFLRGVSHPPPLSPLIQACHTLSQQIQQNYSALAPSSLMMTLDRDKMVSLWKKHACAPLSSFEPLLHDLSRGITMIEPHLILNLAMLVALKHLLPIMGCSLDIVQGSLIFDLTSGGEAFSFLGGEKRSFAQPGEGVFRDEEGMVCKSWGWYAKERKVATPSSSRFIFALEDRTGVSPSPVLLPLYELHSLLVPHFKESISLYMLSPQEPEISPRTELTPSPPLLPLTKPTYWNEEPFMIRQRKLQEIRKRGMNPYPHRFVSTRAIGEVCKSQEHLLVGSSEEALQQKTEQVAVAGRLMLFRAMGKNAFAQIEDHSGRIQLMCNREHTQVSSLPKEELPLKFIEKELDLGDIIGVEGWLFRTKKGELTLFVSSLTLLCKALLPLPDKHSGLVNQEVRHRKRWTDLIVHPQIRERFAMRSHIFSIVREFFHQQEFLEVETPILQNRYGGAEASPFVTQLNALHQTVYLRIALEISLKKLLVGGIARLFEIGKVFRNEGIDRTHHPEFTMLEAYASYWDESDMRCCVEKLFAKIANILYGTTLIGERYDRHHRAHQIDLTPPWKVMTMKESLKVYGHLDVDLLSNEELCMHLKESSIDPSLVARASRGELIAYLFDEFVVDHLIQPHHIIEHPIETTPFCKLCRTPQREGEEMVERFESFILGYEFCNAYSELNDPELQRRLLEKQRERGGSEEFCVVDEEFLEALCQGMVPAGGVGIGMDRLVMLFSNVSSIREVLYFPIMRSDSSHLG